VLLAVHPHSGAVLTANVRLPPSSSNVAASGDRV